MFMYCTWIRSNHNMLLSASGQGAGDLVMSKVDVTPALWNLQPSWGGEDKEV
jgi:hypothetical protein